jgi:hypothetical protein
MKEEEIIEFIYDNFTNGRKKLFPKINKFLLNDDCTQILKREFGKLENIPFILGSHSSDNLRNSRTKSSEIGDICDIWTFCLNPYLLEDCKEEILYYKIEESVNKGNEIHICKVWTNWFIPVYYVEITYEFKDKKKGIEQYGELEINDKNEIENYQNVINILTNLGYQKLDLPFLDTKLKNISTDCSESKNATIFECLFSDLVYPSRHIRKEIYKKSKSKLPKMSIIEHLDKNRDLKLIEAEIFNNGYSSLNLIFDNESKLTQLISRGGKIEKKKNEITIKYIDKKTNS